MVRNVGAIGGQALGYVFSEGCGPRFIVVVHGTELKLRDLKDWTYCRSVQLDYIRSGRPEGNAFIEFLSGQLQDEWLTPPTHFDAEAQHVIEAWRIECNERPPLSSLEHLTPNEFTEQPQTIEMAEEAVSSS